jgi:hypothetical protein
MDQIARRYKLVATLFYDYSKCLVGNASYTRYLIYASEISTIYFPKLAYENQFEPEYTPWHVKYNAPIVLTIFGITIYLANKGKC